MRESLTNDINMDYLKLFGILSCPGKTNAKAGYFFDLASLGSDSITPADINEMFEKTCALASWELLTSISKINETEDILDEKEIKMIKGRTDSLKHEFVIESFQGKTNLTKERWLKNNGQNHWFYDLETL